MKKTDAPKAAPMAFNPRAAKAVTAYMDLPGMVLDGNLPALKAASMLKINLSKPYSVQPNKLKPAYETQLIILAMEAGQRDVFTFLVGNERTNLNTTSKYQHGPEGLQYPTDGTPLDAAYNLKKHKAADGEYFYAQLITNGARATVGKHAAEIKKDLPEVKKPARQLGHKIIGTTLERPARS